MSLWRPFAVFLLVYAVSLFFFSGTGRVRIGCSASIAPALALAVAAMVGSFLLEVFGWP